MDLNALLDMPELGLTLLSGDNHLNRRVRWVVPTDLRDPRRYLTGGELVLTGMLWRHDDTDAEQFVGCLAAAGVAALGAGDPELDRIPDELVSACRHHDLPLFAVSSDVSFSTITERVVQRLSAGRSGNLAALLGRHRHLIASGSGLTEVLDLIDAELGLNCQVISPTGRLIRHCADTGRQTPTPNERMVIADRLLRGGALPRRISLSRHRGFSAFGIGETVPTGWFLIVDDDHTAWPPERRAVIEEVIALIGLDLERQLHRPPAEADLIAALDGDTGPRELAAAFHKAGMRRQGRHIVAVTTAEGPDCADLGSAITAELIAPMTGVSVWAAIAEQTIAIAELTTDLDRLLEHVRHGALALSRGLSRHRVAIGVSGPTGSLDGLIGALSEARHARRLAAARDGSIEAAGPDEMTSHVLLLSAAPAELRRTYRDRVLDPLLEYDRQHSSDLIATLEQFLESEGSWSRCAAALHLHVNTLRYRIDRIEQLTGRDLRKLADRVDLFLAMRLR